MRHERDRKRTSPRAILALCALGLVLCGPAAAQSGGARIQVGVTGEDGEPMGAVEIDLVATDEDGATIAGTKTDKKGRFTLPAVREGLYRIELRTPGLRVSRVDLEVRAPGGGEATQFGEDVPPGAMPTPFQVLQARRMKLDLVLAPQEERPQGGGSLAAAADDSKHLQELNALFSAGDMAGLATAAAQVVAEDPDLGGAWYLLGVGQWQSGRAGEAVVSFRKAVELVPDQPGVRGALASALLDHGDALAAAGDEAGARAAWEEAVPLIDAQCAATPDDATFLTNRIVVLERLERKDALIPAIEALLAVNAEDLRGYLRLAEVHAAAGDRAKAMEVLDSIPSPDHATAVAIYNIAVDMYNEGQYEGMIAVLQKALTIEPGAADPHRLLGRAYLSMGDNATAIAELKEFLRLAPPDDPNAPVERQLLEALEKQP